MFRIILVSLFLFSSHAFAAGKATGVGLHVGTGIPFLGQGGINYQFSDNFNFYANYNLLSLDSGVAKVELSMPEIGFLYHPFSGSFFIGLGVGKESLEVSAVEDFTAQTIKAEVDATTAIGKLGWMWGATNGGFWFGIDFAYVSPMNSEVTITAPGVPTNDPDYVDMVDAAEKFGDSAFINITFARFGYIF